MNQQDYFPITSSLPASTLPRRTILVTIITAITTTLLVLAVSYRTSFLNSSSPLNRWNRANAITPAVAPVAVPAFVPDSTAFRSSALCACPANYAPVCCFRRKEAPFTAPNSCVCECGEDWVLHYPGPCKVLPLPSKAPCICPAIYDPVCCAKDGQVGKESNACSCTCGGGSILPGTDC